MVKFGQIILRKLFLYIDVLRLIEFYFLLWGSFFLQGGLMLIKVMDFVLVVTEKDVAKSAED